MQEKDECNNYMGEMFCKKKGEIGLMSCYDCNSYHPTLSKSWHDLTMSISESMGIVKFLDWLTEKIEKR